MKYQIKHWKENGNSRSRGRGIQRKVGGEKEKTEQLLMLSVCVWHQQIARHYIHYFVPTNRQEVYKSFTGELLARR